MTAHQRPPTLDPVALARWQGAAPLASPWLHEEVATRMLDRLGWITMVPTSWAHWGAVRGGLQAHAALQKSYPAATCFVVEATPARQQAASEHFNRPWWNAWPKLSRGRTQVQAVPPGGVDMLWANMALHEAVDPQALLAEWHGALKVEGFLMFSCLGPDTARELRGLYAELGWPAAGHELTDMHDWGDMLVQTGFAEPVMDMERITLTFDTPARLLQELRGLGRNFHPQRFAALRGRAWRARLDAALVEHAVPTADGRLSLTFEVIYGHAFKPAPRVKVSAQSAVSMQDMRNMLQSGRPKVTGENGGI